MWSRFIWLRKRGLHNRLGSCCLAECPLFLQRHCLLLILTYLFLRPISSLCAVMHFLQSLPDDRDFSPWAATNKLCHGWPRNGGWIRGRGTDLCVLQTFQTVGPTQPPVQWVAGAIYLWVMQSRCVIVCMHNTRMPLRRSASFRRGTSLSLPILGVARIHYVSIGANILGF
jgi:hypothetical protein